MRGGIRSYNKQREPASGPNATDGQILYTARFPSSTAASLQTFLVHSSVVLVVAALISLYLVKRYNNKLPTSFESLRILVRLGRRGRAGRRCFASTTISPSLLSSSYLPRLLFRGRERHAEENTTLQRPIGILYLLSLGNWDSCWHLQHLFFTVNGQRRRPCPSRGCRTAYSPSCPPNFQLTSRKTRPIRLHGLERARPRHYICY
ncbi:hypothetical protein SCHPADRAFT_601308 [Schizopora paradoxa]|uniref:Uncharacterized protein n=1 Tax=Schizopora paradoxa TaxID=27342 RepID=A0A0H2RGM9_9AGAM|nr:hypothetical protein SCHPADRAFT_601308 [Schizopora paradoxa]